jgi:hypothetical protein
MTVGGSFATDLPSGSPLQRPTPPARRWSAKLSRLDGPRRGPMLLALLVTLPIIVAQAKLFGTHWYPGGDMAQAELHVRGLWSHPPLVGAAGRIAGSDGLQGSHPGPSLWLALWPVYALFGRTSRGLMVSVGFVHIVSVAAALWLARRRGGTSMMLCVAGSLALIIRASGTDFATEPWNPWLAVIPFAVFVLLCWTAVEGELWALAAAVLVGSHCIQCHAGYAVVVLAMLAATTLFVVVAARRGHRIQRQHADLLERRLDAMATADLDQLPAGATPDFSRHVDADEESEAEAADEYLGFDRRLVTPSRALAAFVVSAVVGGVAWLPPVIDQWRRTPGNLSVLIHHFGSPTEPYIARREAVKIVANQLNLFGPWMRGRELLAVNVIGLLALLALWAAAIIISARHNQLSVKSLSRLHGLLLTGTASGTLSVTRVFGGYFEYTVRWWWILTGLIVATSITTLWQAFTSPIWTWSTSTIRVDGQGSIGEQTTVLGSSRRLPKRVARALPLLAVGALVAVAITGGAQAADRSKLPGAADSTIVGGLAPTLVSAIRGLDDPTASRQYPPRYLVRWFDPQYLGASAFGLVLELERQGIEVGVDPQFSAAALPHRVLGEDQADGVLYLVIGERIESMRDEGLTELTAFDIRTPAQASRSVEVRQLLIVRFTEIGRPELADELDKQYGLTSLLFSPTPLPSDISDLVIEYLNLGQPAAVFLVAPGVAPAALPEFRGPGS